MEGTYGSNKYLAWDMHIRKCVNTTENGNRCYSDERINEVYQMFFVHILQSNNVIDPSNLENPIANSYNSKWLRVSTLVSRQEINYLQIINFVSDEGFMLESIKTKQTYEVYRTENDSFNIPNPVPFFRYLLSITPTQKTILRQYIKVQKISADIGGILKFFLVISAFLNRIFSKVVFLKESIHKINKEENKGQTDEEKDKTKKTPSFKMRMNIKEVNKVNNYFFNKRESNSREEVSK